MTKEELRRTFLEDRRKLSPGVCAQYNIEIYNHFFTSVDLSFIKVIHTYLPMVKNNEPDTWLIADRIRREFPNIRTSIPKVNKQREIESFYFEGLHQLVTSTWGIQEPKQGVPTPNAKIDLVIVPLLVVDKRGHRVGYGQGYYDRFLSKCRTDCKKVGLSFFEPVDQISDIEDFDVPLDACISPQGVVNFG